RAPAEERFATQIELDVRSPRFRCEDWFVYELDNVSGHISIRAPYRTILSDFVGSSRGAKVGLAGKILTSTVGKHIALKILGRNVPLDGKLRSALPACYHTTWDALAPEGRADVECLAAKPAQTPLDLRLWIDPAGAAITPACVPYRLQDFDGLVYFA